MSKVAESRPPLTDTVAAAAEWGIEPVPPDRRALRALDLAVLWGDLGIGLLVLVTGALLVDPNGFVGMGFWPASLAIVIGSIVGVALLALAGLAGADHGIATMVLFRPSLGLRGSWIPSVLNAAQLVGWTAVEFWAMSFVADLVSSELFGFSARWLWLGASALVCTALALWGPVGVTRIWMERFSAWIILAICAGLTALVLISGDLAGAIGRRGTGFSFFGSALDLVIVMPVSWIPLVADYNRFARRSSEAFWGTFTGYLIANIWLYLLGALLVVGAGASASPLGIATGVLALTGGTLVGITFLVGLLAGETDEAFADLYSAAVSLRNIGPRLSQRGLVVSIALLSLVLAAWLSMERYETFLFLIGSVFVPLFGILAADYFVKRRRRINARQLYESGGAYWYSGGFRIVALVPLIAGFATYHWIAPTGPDWWTSLTASWFGDPLSQQASWLPASLPSFVVAFVVSLVVFREKTAVETPD